MIDLFRLLEYVNRKSGSYVYDSQLAKDFGVGKPYSERALDESLHPISPFREGLHTLEVKGLIKITQNGYVIPKGECGRRVWITEKGKHELNKLKKLTENLSNEYITILE